MQRFGSAVFFWLIFATSAAFAGGLSKTLIAADIADHLSRLEQGMDLISEFALSANDVRKIATELRAGAYDDFKKPKVTMKDNVTIEVAFDSRIVSLDFHALERDEIWVQKKAINLKGSKTYANYSAEIDKILGLHGHRANEVTGLLATVTADVGYRVTNSSLRDFGGTKATSVVSDEKTLAADIIGFYRAQHARCVRGQHDGQREVSEFCTNEKYQAQCSAAQHQVERACEAQIESYFVCGKDKKVAAAGTWDNDAKSFVRFSTKQPSVTVVKNAFGACCAQQGCYRVVRHDLVDLYKRGPASVDGAASAEGGAAQPAAAPVSPSTAPRSVPASASAMPNRFEPSLPDRSGFSHH